jgi:nicotinamide-nucleotide amidase
MREEIEELAAQAGTLLSASHLSLATAESCTGGMVAEAVTSVPGSSLYFLGGIVAYDNRIKESVLCVRRALLDKHGSVSKEVVSAMAKGAIDVLKADCAIAVSGIAGPGGGTQAKPVGLVYIGIALPAGTTVQEFRFAGDREEIRQHATLEGLRLLCQRLGG